MMPVLFIHLLIYCLLYDIKVSNLAVVSLSKEPSGSKKSSVNRTETPCESLAKTVLTLNRSMNVCNSSKRGTNLIRYITVIKK